ncbi:MAG: hypothetical protein Q7J35_13615 [Candidatus Methanoperedens sp.]|nr:hypothetical protein [Candidatus Methanoperedens sp.]
MSELKFMGFFINPVINERGEVKSIAEEDFLEDRTYQVRTDVYSIKFPTYVKKVRCKEKPLFLIIGNKITNLGLIKANINEIRYYMTYPKHDRPFVIEKEISLAHEETEPIILNFPVDTKIWNYTLKGGTIVLKFEAISTTRKYSEQVWIHISDDLKLIEWSESRLMLFLIRLKSMVGSLKKNRLNTN